MPKTKLTDQQKLEKVLKEIGVPFELTDDSEESELDENLMTVIEIKGEVGHVYFMFKRDGSFKEIHAF